jgi:hypothetical protein
MAAAFTWYDFAERHLPVASEDRELALFLRDRIREQFTPAEVARFLERERSIEGRAWLEPKEGS